MRNLIIKVAVSYPMGEMYPVLDVFGHLLVPITFLLTSALLLFLGFPVDPRKVLIVAGHHNWIVAAYAHFAVCYRYEYSGLSG